MSEPKVVKVSLLEYMKLALDASGFDYILSAAHRFAAVLQYTMDYNKDFAKMGASCSDILDALLSSFIDIHGTASPLADDLMQLADDMDRKLNLMGKRT